MKNIGILIFARVSSRRFPGKVFKNIIFNKSLLEIVFLRLKKYFNLKIIICTSVTKKDEKSVKFCKKKKIKYFRGSLNNVFERTVGCILKYKLDAFVRINADRPFVDFKEIKKMIAIFKKKKFDIITNQLTKNCPKGLASEIANSKIFLNMPKNKLKKKDKEHIFNFFYRNKKKYKIFNLNNKYYKINRLKNFSIDKPLDLFKVKEIYSYFGSIYVPTKKILIKNDKI